MIRDQAQGSVVDHRQELLSGRQCAATAFPGSWNGLIIARHTFIAIPGKVLFWSPIIADDLSLKLIMSAIIKLDSL